MKSMRFEDAQLHRERYIRELNKQSDKTYFAKANADSLYSLGLCDIEKKHRHRCTLGIFHGSQ